MIWLKKMIVGIKQQSLTHLQLKSNKMENKNYKHFGKISKIKYQNRRKRELMYKLIKRLPCNGALTTIRLPFWFYSSVGPLCHLSVKDRPFNFQGRRYFAPSLDFFLQDTKTQIIYTLLFTFCQNFLTRHCRGRLPLLLPFCFAFFVSIFLSTKCRDRMCI